MAVSCLHVVWLLGIASLLTALFFFNNAHVSAGAGAQQFCGAQRLSAMVLLTILHMSVCLFFQFCVIRKSEVAILRLSFRSTQTLLSQHLRISHCRYACFDILHVGSLDFVLLTILGSKELIAAAFIC